MELGLHIIQMYLMIPSIIFQSRFISDDLRSPSPRAIPQRSFRDVTVFVSQLNDKIDILLKEIWPKILNTGTKYLSEILNNTQHNMFPKFR